jgi:hypothetical protein
LNCSENPKSLSEVLLANASDEVVPSHNLKLRDVLPRRPRIFMSHTFSGDGTGECCQRIKSGLQERLLCTVWFHKAEMGWTDAFVDEMKRDMANARAFVMCLTPLALNTFTEDPQSVGREYTGFENQAALDHHLRERNW